MSRYDPPACEYCGRAGHLVHSLDSWLCQRHSDKYWAEHSEWAYAAADLTPVVVKALALHHRDRLLHRPHSDEFYIVSETGTYKQGDIATVSPSWALHPAVSVARYTVHISAVGPKSDDGTATVFFCDIIDVAGPAVWPPGNPLLSSSAAAKWLGMGQSTTRKAAATDQVPGAYQDPCPGSINPPWRATRSAWQEWYDNRRPVGRPGKEERGGENG